MKHTADYGSISSSDDHVCNFNKWTRGINIEEGLIFLPRRLRKRFIVNRSVPRAVPLVFGPISNFEEQEMVARHPDTLVKRNNTYALKSLTSKTLPKSRDFEEYHILRLRGEGFFPVRTLTVHGPISVLIDCSCFGPEGIHKFSDDRIHTIRQVYYDQYLNKETDDEQEIIGIPRKFTDLFAQRDK